MFWQLVQVVIRRYGKFWHFFFISDTLDGTKEAKGRMQILLLILHPELTSDPGSENPSRHKTSSAPWHGLHSMRRFTKLIPTVFFKFRSRK